MEQLSTVNMVVSTSRACLGVGTMKGTLTSAWILAVDNTVSLLPSDIFEHQDLCWASHFLLASSSCSFPHWWAIRLQAGVVDDGGGGEVKGCGVQTVGGYMARFRCGEGCLGLSEVAG